MCLENVSAPKKAVIVSKESHVKHWNTHEVTIVHTPYKEDHCRHWRGHHFRHRTYRRAADASKTGFQRVLFIETKRLPTLLPGLNHPLCIHNTTSNELQTIINTQHAASKRNSHPLQIRRHHLLRPLNSKLPATLLPPCPLLPSPQQTTTNTFSLPNRASLTT